MFSPLLIGLPIAVLWLVLAGIQRWVGSTHEAISHMATAFVQAMYVAYAIVAVISLLRITRDWVVDKQSVLMRIMTVSILTFVMAVAGGKLIQDVSAHMARNAKESLMTLERPNAPADDAILRALPLEVRRSLMLSDRVVTNEDAHKARIAHEKALAESMIIERQQKVLQEKFEF